MSPIEIVLRAIGADAVADAFLRVSSGATNMGGNLQNATSQANQAGQALGQTADQANHAGQALQNAGQQAAGAAGAIQNGAQGASTALNNASGAADHLGQSIDDAGNSNGLGQVADDAEDLSEDLDDAGQHATGLVDTLEKVRNAGMWMTGIGAGGIALSKSLQEAYNEGNRAQLKMEQMLEKRKEMSEIDPMNEWAGKLAEDAFMDDDDPLKEATAQMLGFGFSAKQVRDIMPGLIGQSRLYNSSLDSVAMAMGKAFAAGKAGGLTKIGLTLDKSDIKALNDMEKSGASFAAQQAAMLVVINKSMEQYALSMNQGLTEADKAINQIAYSMDNLQGALGEGAIEADASIKSIVASIFNLANASPEVAKAAGYWGTYGAYALSAGGAVLTVGSQVAITAASLTSLGVTGASAMASIKMAALGAGGSILALTAAALLAVSAIAAAVVMWNKHKDAILNPVSSSDDTRTQEQFTEDTNKKVYLDQQREKLDKLSPRDRYVVSHKMAQAYIDLGAADEASEMQQMRRQLGRQLPKKFKDVSSAEGRAMMDDLNGTKWDANKGARLNGDSFNKWSKARDDKDAKSAEAKQDDLQKQYEALQKRLAADAAKAGAPKMPAQMEVQGPKAQRRTRKSREAGAEELDEPHTGATHPVIEAVSRAHAKAKERHKAEGQKAEAEHKERAREARSVGALSNGGGVSSLRSTSGSKGSSGLTSGELLRYIENGGSLFTVPTGGGSGASSGASGESTGKGSAGPRTGSMSLRETGRSQNGDGTEQVAVTGTLTLKQSGGSLQQAKMGFRI